MALGRGVESQRRCYLGLSKARREDWYRIRIDDVVRGAVVTEDGNTAKEAFAERQMR